jgi:hypothetical protein
VIAKGGAAIRLFGSAHGDHWHNLWLHPECLSEPPCDKERFLSSFASSPEGFPVPGWFSTLKTKETQ